MKFLPTLFLLFLSFSIFAQQEVTRSYQIDDTNISNPERGFYHHTEANSFNYNNLNLNTLMSYQQNESITQILRVFYLDNFVNGLISKEYLDGMHEDFNIARAAGIKIIVRFAYTKTSSKPYGDATPATVKNHVFQLKEVLTTHHDVIAVVQTGFVGAWGEWYYTDHFAGDQPWIISDENWEDRGNLVEDLLHVLPKDRMIQIRTPGYKMRIYDTENPITLPEAYSQENITRVGHHNDCFVASSSDFGTYVNPTVEKPYLEAETKFLAMGGETCALAPPYSDCTNAYGELKRFHWSYLNIDYNNTVLNTWKDQGCYDSVELNLGYRYVLNEATLQAEVHPEGTFDLSLNLKNHGFANPYNPRDFEIILKSTTTNQTYKLKTDETMGLWTIGENFQLNIEGGFPNEIIEDTYKVYLNLPDQSPSLRGNPAYSIRLANQNMWEPNEGWNDLDMDLIVSSSFPSTNYSGTLFFNPSPLAEVVVAGPNDIFEGVNDDLALLFWGKSENHNYRNVERSADGTTFETIATLPASIDFYKILDPDNNSFYRFGLLGENGEVSYSDTLLIDAIPTGGNTPLDIVADGMDEDWKDVLPTASTLDNNNAHILRTYFSLEKAHFAIYGGFDNYKIFLNTDQLNSTGTNQSALLTGMDYKLEDGSLFKFENGGWILHSIDVVSSNGDVFEVEVNHALFENLENNSLIPMVAYFNDDDLLLSDSETYPAIYVRNLAPDIPANLEIKNSIPYPEERLEVHWDVCTYCEGYILEKSDNGIDFVFLEDLDADKEIFYHDFLPNGTHYYRIKSYNLLGESQPSEIKSGYLGLVSTTRPEQNEAIKIWPNPTDEFISTDATYESVRIYNVYDLLMETKKNDGKDIDISHLPSGVYFLVFVKNEKEWVKKVIKR